MQIQELNPIPNPSGNTKQEKSYARFQKLLTELRKRELPDDIVASINHEIDKLNVTSASGNNLVKLLAKTEARIIKLLEKEVKLVPKNYYMMIWMAIGMSAFGLPIGVALGLSLGNMAFIGIGLPIGMPIGIAIGAAMDKKASDEGRQLDLG